MRLALLSAVVVCAACTRHPRDVGNQKLNPRSEFEDPGPGGTPSARRAVEAGVPEAGPPGARAVVLAHASSRTITTDTNQLYFGDAEDDTVLALAKRGTRDKRDKITLARRAPTRGGLAVSDEAIAWIASPGNTVLRANKGDPSKPEILRQGGIFAQIACDKSEVFFTEALGPGGVVFQAARTTTKLATFDGAPRGLAVDATHVYLVSPLRVARIARERGTLETLATGSGLSEIAVDETSVYTLAADTNGRIVLRIPKTGGAAAILQRGVANAPIAVHRGELYWLDATRPALRALAIGSGTARLVSDDPVLAQVNAIRVDDDGVFLATGDGEDAEIVVIGQRSQAASKM